MPGVTIFMHENFIRGDKKRCLLMRSIVKSASSSSSVQAAPTLDGNALGTTSVGSFMNHNLFAGLPRSFMGLPGQVSQLNPLSFPQVNGGPVNNMQNLIQQHIVQQLLQQQANNNLHGLLYNNGNSLNSFQFQGANLSSPTMNVNAPNSAPFANTMINVQSNSGIPDTSQQQTVASIPTIYSATQSSSSSASQSLLATTESSLPNANLTSSSPPSAAAAVDSNCVTGTSSACGNDSTDPDPIVVLAMQIMQNNPSLDSRMALELARKLKGDH